jgi:sodium transport system permease protein
LEGNYWLALQVLPVVLAVTLSACWLAVRWAVEQFNSEAVLFRGGEQFSVRLWLRHLLRDRQPTPTLAAAVACGMLVLLGRFFLTFTGSAPTPGDFGSFVRSILLVQLLVIAAPGVLMALVLTRSVRQTLLLRMPSRRAALGAVALAVVFHPLTHALQVAVQRLYPIGRDLSESLAKMQETLAAPPLWQLLLVLGLLPAVCEELTFRGFILSGLGRLGHKGRAIVYSAVLFGLAHAILQQSLIACLVGVVIGVVAVQSGSILPGMLFHFCHNALAVANARITPEAFAQWPALDFIASPAGKQGCDFSWPIMVYCMAAGATILLWFARNGAVGVHALACGDTLKRELQPTR